MLRYRTILCDGCVTVGDALTGAQLTYGEAFRSQGSAPYFACIVAQGFSHQFNAARNFVAHQLLPDVLPQCLDSDLTIHVYNCVNTLTQVLIGKADHATRTHGRIGVQHSLDIRWINIGATASHHVVEPVGQAQISLLVHPPHISQGFPAVLGFRLRAQGVFLFPSSVAFLAQNLSKPLLIQIGRRPTPTVSAAHRLFWAIC